jgi:hypothetical protein
MLSVGPFVDAPAAAGPADTAALRNPKDVIANGMCSARFIDRNELRREIFFAGHLSLGRRVSHRLQDATAD